MLAVFAERQGARGVPAVGRQIEDVLGIACAFGGLLVVVEADYFASVADVDVIIVKGNAKRAFEISGKTSRCEAPPVCCGSRRTITSPAPVSAAKMSPFGAVVRKRTYLNSCANTFTWKPGGTFGRNPSGLFTREGPLPADFVAKGGGSCGFFP